EMGMTENGSATSRGLCRPYPEERASASASAESNARARVSKGPLGALWRNEAKRQRRAHNQPAVVENDRSFASPVSGLLFTGACATRACEPSAGDACVRGHERKKVRPGGGDYFFFFFAACRCFGGGLYTMASSFMPSGSVK